jgi:thiamine biosynthesis lipoprotein
MPSSPRPTEAAGIPDKFAGLLEMGFERVDPGPVTAESLRIDATTHKVTQIRSAMGSFVAISALHESHDLAEEAIGCAFEEMDRLIGILNRFDPGSALTFLNETGRIDGPPPELAEVVDCSLACHRASRGAFDVTVKPLIDLHRDSRTYEPLASPSPTEISEALDLVGPENLRCRDGGIFFGRSGMGLTLDGVAKGYVVDAVAESLASNGAGRFLINAGGDIRAAGRRGDQLPWTVAIRDPRDEVPSFQSSAWERDEWVAPNPPDTLNLRDGAVATSGGYEVYFDRERLAHHIVEGDSGRSPRNALSVTVTAPTTVAADSLATAVFVLGPQQGVRLIDALPGNECLIIDSEGNELCSRGWRGVQAPVSE